MTRIVFFGDAEWGARSLLRLHKEGHEVLAVVARVRPSDGSLATAAGTLRLPVLSPPDVNDESFVDRIRALAPDLNVSVSYDQFLRRAIRESAPLGFLNFHAGMLPLYRGRNPINWALINGESEVGITGHFVDAGIDTGDIVHQRAVPVSWTDTYGDVLERVVDAIPDVVSETVRLVAAGNPPRRAQSHLPGTYYAARGPGDERIDWHASAASVHNLVRAITHPGPGAVTHLGATPILVWKAFHDPSWPRSIGTPGRVVGRRPGEGVLVTAGDSTILLQEVEEPGKPPSVPAWPIGTRLGIDLLQRVLDLERRVEELTRGTKP